MADQMSQKNYYQRLLLEWIQETKAAARQENYPLLASYLRRMRSCKPDEIPNLIELFPLVEALGLYRYFLDSQDNTGPGEALAFFRHVAEKIPQGEERQQALVGWQKTIKAFVEMSPLLAAEEIVNVMVTDAVQEIKNHAADAVDDLLAHEVFMKRAGPALLAKMSQHMFLNDYEDKATRFAQRWRGIMNRLPLEDALAKVMETGSRMDCSSPLETELSDFVHKNHRKAARLLPDVAQAVLEDLVTFSKPGGACCTEARKKLQTLLPTNDERGGPVRVRSGKGYEHYDF